MNSCSAITKTRGHKFVIVPRLLAGLPLLGFGLLHFFKPDHFREILIASDIPMVELNMYAAPAAEAIGGILLLLGLYARVGGILGIATMAVAIYTTVVFSGMAVADLPDELRAQIPETEVIYAVHNAAGDRLALVPNKRLAFELAKENDLAPVSVH